MTRENARELSRDLETKVSNIIKNSKGVYAYTNTVGRGGRKVKIRKTR